HWRNWHIRKPCVKPYDSAIFQHTSYHSVSHQTQNCVIRHVMHLLHAEVNMQPQRWARWYSTHITPVTSKQLRACDNCKVFFVLLSEKASFAGCYMPYSPL